jgi:hypothetical protein
MSQPPPDSPVGPRSPPYPPPRRYPARASSWSTAGSVRPLGASTYVAVAATALLTLLEVVQAMTAFPAGTRYVAAARSETDVSSIYTLYDATAVFVLAMALMCWVATCVWLTRA